MLRLHKIPADRLTQNHRLEWLRRRLLAMLRQVQHLVAALDAGDAEAAAQRRKQLGVAVGRLAETLAEVMRHTEDPATA